MPLSLPIEKLQKGRPRENDKLPNVYSDQIKLESKHMTLQIRKAQHKKVR